MPAERPRWLDIVRFRARGTRALLLLVLQHHIIEARTVIAAPLRPTAGDADIFHPVVQVEGLAYAVSLLDLAALPLAAVGGVVGSALGQADAIADGLDAIFRGHPVGLPR
jgi:hypothetical protein